MENEKLDNTTIIGIDPAAPGADRTKILTIGDDRYPGMAEKLFAVDSLDMTDDIEVRVISAGEDVRNHGTHTGRMVLGDHNIIDGNRSITTGGRMTGLRSAGIALAAMSASMAGAAMAAGDFSRALDLLPRAKPKKRHHTTPVTNEYGNNLRKIKKAIGARQVRKERKKFNRMLKASNDHQS